MVKKKRSKRVVVDACVGTSAGHKDHPVSTACRRTLEALLASDCVAVFSPALSDEWRRHRSALGTKWQASMAARGRRERVEDAEDATLKTRVCSVFSTNAESDAAGKDIHLVEVARSTDNRVLSRDEACKELFVEAAVTVAELRPIQWGSVVADSTSVLKWIAADLASEEGRSLGRIAGVS